MAIDATSPGGGVMPAASQPRRPALIAFTGRVVGAALVVGALSHFARQTIRTHPPVPAGSAKADLGIVFVPATPPGPHPAEPIGSAGRLRLDRAGDPVRIEPARDPRQQTLARGDFSVIEASHLRLTLTRDAPEPAPGLFVTLARRAAEGMDLSVLRTSARGQIATKFGAVETLDATLAGPQSRVCTGFVTLDARPVRIDGWLCAPLGQPPEPRSLACTLDALALDAPASDQSTDPATEAVFARAERRRDPACDPIRALSDLAPEGHTGSIAPRRAAAARKPAPE